jgi:hypothetical protein
MIRNGLILSVFLAAGVYAQEAPKWEVGVIGGYAYAPPLKISGGTGEADTGIKHGGVVGVFGGNDDYRFWSGELRYLYRYSDVKLSSGSTDVSFGAHTHIVNGDFLAHWRPREAKVRPFFAFGGGVKFLVGTGFESSSQKLGNFAALTATREILPTADVGVGVKINHWKHMRVRVEMRDYISPAPEKVILAAPGRQIHRWLNDIMGLAAVSYTW